MTRKIRLADSALVEARYQAERAEAQFNTVDPGNHNVFHNLARKWEECLARVQACESRLQALFFANPPDTSQLLIVANSARHGLMKSS